MSGLLEVSSKPNDDPGDAQVRGRLIVESDARLNGVEFP